jgi:hypothetical protein
MSITLYLRFPDEATFRASLPADFIQYGETGSPLPEGVQAISIIGILYTQEDVPALISGWHVNVSGELPDAWKPYEISPTTPSRIFG